MFNPNGQPTGYDQIAPGRDLPKPQGQTPLNRAIMGGQQPAQAPSQYKPDDTMMAFRQRQPGAQPPIAQQQNYGAMTDANGMVTNGINPIDGSMLGPNQHGYVSGPQNQANSPNAAPHGGGSGSPMGSGSPNDPANYALSLIQSGMDPAQAAQQTNQKFNLQTGSQAVYYPGNNTIGLPGVYLAGPTGRPDSPNAWGITQRQPERPHAMMNTSLMSAIQPGTQNQSDPYYKTLLQQLLQQTAPQPQQ